MKKEVLDLVCPNKDMPFSIGNSILLCKTYKTTTKEMILLSVSGNHTNIQLYAVIQGLSLQDKQRLAHPG